LFSVSYSLHRESPSELELICICISLPFVSWHTMNETFSRKFPRRWPNSWLSSSRRLKALHLFLVNPISFINSLLLPVDFDSLFYISSEFLCDFSSLNLQSKNSGKEKKLKFWLFSLFWRGGGGLVRDLIVTGNYVRWRFLICWDTK